MIKCSFAAEQKSLIFPMMVQISIDSLYYGITEVSFSPENVELNYDSTTKTFDSVNIDFNVVTNVLTSSQDDYTYSLILDYGESYCTTFNGEKENYEQPTISMMIGGVETTLTESDSYNLDFTSSITKGGSEYLSDTRKLLLTFSEPQPEKPFKDFEVCKGYFTFIVGLEL